MGPGAQGPWNNIYEGRGRLYKKRVAVVSTMSPPSVGSGGVPSAGNAPAGSIGGDGKCTRCNLHSLLGVGIEAIRRNTIATIEFSDEA